MNQLNNPTLLDRLFRRSANPLVAKIHAHAIGQSLLVHPAIGERMLGAFLTGAIDTPPPIRAAATDVDGNPIVDTPTGIDPSKVAFLNISGALVNRPMPDLCGDGPVSYAAIRNAFDQALLDDNVEAIVLRMNSPGGMASGCFDTTDHIFSSRGGKRIYGLVDDMAYSACYGFAAACDEIWVSRTGGVGSVGVVAWHADISEADKKAGIKMTPIYSGARKIDFSPYMPLSPEALAEAQQDSDDLRELFVETVAKYRGLDPDAVRATEAGTFRGQAAVDAGFADRVGTVYDLLAYLAQPPSAAETTDPTTDPEGSNQSGDDATARSATHAAEDTVQPPPLDAPPPALDSLTAEQKTALARGELAIALDSTNLPPAVVTALMSIDLTVAPRPPADLVADASKIVDLCVAAGLPDLAADSVKSGATVEQTRSSLAAARAAGERELVTTLPALGAAKPADQLNVLDGVSIYQLRGNRNGS